jgi:hypothetical protein
MGSDARLAPNETAESVCNETYALSLPLLDNKQPGALPESGRSVRVCASNKPQQSGPSVLFASMCRVECPLVPPVAGTIPQLKDKIEEIFAHVDAAERKQASPRPDPRACVRSDGRRVCAQ